MDYLKEIQRFNELLPKSRGIGSMTISLWYALMYFSHKRNDTKSLELSLSDLESQSKLSRFSISKEREKLSLYGLIKYTRPKGRIHGLYEILPLSDEILSKIEEEFLLLSATRSASPATKSAVTATKSTSSATRKQGEMTECALSATSCAVSATSCALSATTQNGAINNIINTNTNSNNRDISIKNKENIKRKKKENEPASATPSPAAKPAPKATPRPSAFQLEPWLATLDAPWQGLMRQWLDYKSARKESYKTEVGARKCLTMLKTLSENNPTTAQSIIDQSIACNYAGLFPLKQSYQRSNPNAPQYGQRIGQIVQPEDDAKRDRIIAKLSGAGQSTNKNNK